MTNKPMILDCQVHRDTVEEAIKNIYNDLRSDRSQFVEGTIRTEFARVHYTRTYATFDSIDPTSSAGLYNLDVTRDGIYKIHFYIPQYRYNNTLLALLIADAMYSVLLDKLVNPYQIDKWWSHVESYTPTSHVLASDHLKTYKNVDFPDCDICTPEMIAIMIDDASHPWGWFDTKEESARRISKIYHEVHRKKDEAESWNQTYGTLIDAIGFNPFKVGAMADVKQISKTMYSEVLKAAIDRIRNLTNDVYSKFWNKLTMLLNTPNSPFAQLKTRCEEFTGTRYEYIQMIADEFRRVASMVVDDLDDLIAANQTLNKPEDPDVQVFYDDDHDPVDPTDVFVYDTDDESDQTDDEELFDLIYD